MSQESDIQNRIADLLESERADSFAPFFADRVMKRLSPETGPVGTPPGLYEALRWVFVRAAIVGVVLILAIGTLNALQFGAGDMGSFVDALLGLPSDSLADMLTYDLI